MNTCTHCDKESSLRLSAPIPQGTVIGDLVIESTDYAFGTCNNCSNVVVVRNGDTIVRGTHDIADYSIVSLAMKLYGQGDSKISYIRLTENGEDIKDRVTAFFGEQEAAPKSESSPANETFTKVDEDELSINPSKASIFQRIKTFFKRLVA